MKTFEPVGVCRPLVVRARELGRRLVWWPRVPALLRVESWWRWTVWLGYAIAAALVAARCDELGLIALYPPRLS